MHRKALTTSNPCDILINSRCLKIQYAGIAQLVEQLIRNQQVACSSHVSSSRISLCVCREIFCFAFVLHPSAQQAATHPKVYFRAGNDLNVVHFLIIVNNGRGRSRTEPAFPCNVECRPDESGIAASVKCPLKVNVPG